MTFVDESCVWMDESWWDFESHLCCKGEGGSFGGGIFWEMGVCVASFFLKKGFGVF